MSLITVTRDDYTNSYRKQGTRTIIRFMFRAWDQFLQDHGLQEASVMVEMRKPETGTKKYVLLDQVRVSFERGRTGQTPKTYFTYLKGWLLYNEIDLREDLIRKYVKFSKPVRERVRGIDRDMIKKTIDLCDPFYQGLWYVQAYTGMRIKSETLNMTWKWIQFEDAQGRPVSPLMITIPGEFAKTSQERITFAGGEAEKWLRQERAARKAEPETECVFQRNGRRLDYRTAWAYFARRRRKLGFLDRGANGRYHYKPHKYRAYAENKLGRGSGGAEFAHSILGHTEGLIEYNQGGTTEEEARQDYVSALPHLAISEEGRLRDENKKLKDTIQKTDTIETEIERIKRFLARHPEFAKEFGK